MDTVNRSSSISSEPSSSTVKKAVISENCNAKVTAVRPQLAIKRPALADLTNKQNAESRSTVVPKSKPMAPCSAKDASKKDHRINSCGKLISKNSLPENNEPSSALISVESGVPTPSKDALLPQNNQPPSGNKFLPTPNTAFSQPRSRDVSPSRYFTSSVSVDETMSNCDFLKSTEFECMDNKAVLLVQSTEKNMSSNLFPFWGTMSVNKTATDDEESRDPQLCLSMASDIYTHLRASEVKNRPSINYMEKLQKDITASMRATLIDWLIEVAEDYMFVPETLYLTVNYLDRYLSGNVVQKKQLQLLGVACMMIAAKYEEICPPNVKEFCEVSVIRCHKKKILQMESAVLNYLKFEMTGPTAKWFVSLFVHVAQKTREVPSAKLECLANYITELSLLEYNMLCYMPSLIAASATFLANFILSPLKKPWNSTIEHQIHYRPSDLCGCVNVLHRICLNIDRSSLRTVREKYSQYEYKFVAKKYCPMSIPPEYLQDVIE